MKIKTTEVDGTTYAVLEDGKPVYIDDDGKEVALDAPTLHQTVKQRNYEAQSHREAKEAAEAKLKAFEGIEDADAAKKAIEVVAGLEDGQLLDAEKAQAAQQAAVDAAVKSYVEKVTTAESDRDAARAELRKEKIGGAFARSKYIAEKLAVPVQMVEATFGKHFSIEDGKVIAKDTTGNTIFSSANPGNIADFDEAMETLVNGFAHKDSILKGAGQKGSGAQPGQGAGAKTLSRGEFEKLAPADAAAKMADGYTLTD